MVAKNAASTAKSLLSLGGDVFKVPASLPLRILFGVFATGAFVFFLFQKKMLSKSASKVVSKLFFLPTFPITILMRVGNYWTTIDDTLYLGCAPMGLLGHPSELHKLGVRGVINMCYEYNGPKSYYSDLGIKQLHLPTVDHFEPTVSQMTEAIQFIKEYKKRGEKVYVHCKAGHGRAASIAMCWMMSELPDVPLQVLTKKIFSSSYIILISFLSVIFILFFFMIPI